MPDTRAVLILANPYSGAGANRQHVQRLTDALQAERLEPRTIWQREQRGEALSDPAVGERWRCIVSAGGDGSLGDVINELEAGVGLTHAPPLAMLPAGNENLFARQFGYDHDAPRMARAIAECRTRTIDLGSAGGRLFTLMASAGFDAIVVERLFKWRLAQSGLRRVARRHYVPRIAAAALQYDFPPITLETDDRRVTGAHAFVFNIGQYGFNLGIARQATCDDGLLDWVVFEKPGRISLATYALAVLRGRHMDRDDVRVGRSRRVVLSAETDVPVQVDGDPAGHAPQEIVAVPNAIRIVQMTAEQ